MKNGEHDSLPYTALFVGAVMLPLFLPLTFSFRSPGTVDSSWSIILICDVLLLAFCSWFLIKVKPTAVSRRIMVYAVMGVTIYILLMLIDVYREQSAFDYWSHKGIKYFDPLD
jgi:hypothetical protein